MKKILCKFGCSTRLGNRFSLTKFYLTLAILFTRASHYFLLIAQSSLSRHSPRKIDSFFCFIQSSKVIHKEEGDAVRFQRLRTIDFGCSSSDVVLLYCREMHSLHLHFCLDSLFFFFCISLSSCLFPIHTLAIVIITRQAKCSFSLLLRMRW